MPGVRYCFSSHSGLKDAKDHSLYWNYAALDGSNPTGSYLFPGESWGVLREEDAQVDLSTVNIVLPGQPVVNQIDAEDVSDENYDNSF